MKETAKRAALATLVVGGIVIAALALEILTAIDSRLRHLPKAGNSCTPRRP